VIALDEVTKVIGPEWLAFEGVVNVRAVVVIPDFFGRGSLAGGRFSQKSTFSFTPGA